jgi:hypothetical protein
LTVKRRDGRTRWIGAAAVLQFPILGLGNVMIVGLATASATALVKPHSLTSKTGTPVYPAECG